MTEVVEMPRRRLILVTVGVMLALLLAALDQTIVGTAMPRIIAELNGFDKYAWVTTAYLLTSTITVPIAGKLGDALERPELAQDPRYATPTLRRDRREEVDVRLVAAGAARHRQQG